MALNFKQSANTLPSLEDIRLLNNALNNLQATQTALVHAKNAEHSAAAQESLEKIGVESATRAVSNISPTDPGYEESLRKAQENLMKRSKSLEKTIAVKNKEQIEITMLEKKLIEQESIVQTTKATLGASGMVYNPLFIDISTTLNQQAILEKDIARIKEEVNSTTGTSAENKKRFIEELMEKLEHENKKLTQLQGRLASGEALFSKPKRSSTNNTEPYTTTPAQTSTEPPLRLDSISLWSIVQIILHTPALFLEEGHKTHFKTSVITVHHYFNFWHKSIFVLQAFIEVAWMSLLAPLEMLFMGTFKGIVYKKNEGPKTFIQWLNPITLLKSIVGFVLGVVIALIGLPFTTLGAAVTLIAGIMAALLTMAGTLVLEGLCILMLIPICFIVSALKTLYLPILRLFKRT